MLANGNDRNWYLNDGWGNSNINPLWSDVWVLDPANGTDALLTRRSSRRSSAARRASGARRLTAAT